jgi:sporulation protein YlmC with PRC-barrel domain
MMKTRSHVAIFGAVTAVSLVASLAVGAEDQIKDKTTSSSYSRTTKTVDDKAIGEVERANKLVGKEIRSSDNQKLGKIDNVVVDLESGRILYVIVGSGGVLGAGEKKHAVAPGLFTESRGNSLRLNVDKAKFDSSPEFTRDIDKDPEIAKADFVSKVYEFGGQNMWWKGSTPANEGSFNNVHKVTELIGKKVVNVSDQDMGKVDNVILDLPAARVVYVIFSPDRDLKLGDNLYALPPNALTLSSDRKHLVSGDLSKEKLNGAPHFDKDNWPTLSDKALASQVYQYYGKQAYFDSGIQPTSERNKERVYPEKK